MDIIYYEYNISMSKFIPFEGFGDYLHQYYDKVSFRKNNNMIPGKVTFRFGSFVNINEQQQITKDNPYGGVQLIKNKYYILYGKYKIGEIRNTALWKHVACGNYYTIGIGNNSLWGWGYNNGGQLGLGNNTDYYVPIEIESDSQWIIVACGSYHTIAIKNDNTLWATGYNLYGQLGINNNTNSNVLTQIDGIWNNVSCGSLFTIAIKNDDTIWGWGQNNHGQLGNGSSDDSNTPIQINDNMWKIVSCGSCHTIAIKNDDTMWAWGCNNRGQLGLDDTENRSSQHQIIDEIKWKVISCGYEFTVAIKNDGTLWSWGYNYYGQLGLGSAGVNRDVPSQIGVDNDWENVSSGYLFAIAIKNDGTIWAWGNNNSGQLGIDNVIPKNIPTKINNDTDWTLLSCGFYHVVAIKSNGTMWSWGENGNGQLGLNDNIDRYTPVQIGSDNDWISVSCGGDHTVAIKNDNSIWAWGYNEDGELGLGDYTHPGIGNRNYSPSQIGTDVDWENVFCGGYHALAVKTDGTLWSWGYNYYGQLGLGYLTNVNEPMKIGTDTDWIFVGCGEYHTLAIKTNNSMYPWGNNNNGQLGLGDTINISEPVNIVKEIGWKHVACGSSHAVAIKNDNSLWSWGYNYFGQLGLGDENSDEIYNKPMQIGIDINWAYVSCGANHTIAIKLDGSIWTWGNNDTQQLGLGITSNKNIPMQIGNEKNWKYVVCNSNHSIAIKSDGSMWGWGSNSNGQLGTGNIKPKYIPTKLNLEKWATVSTSARHTVAIKNDGTIWSWGYNYYGELGLVHNDNTYNPTQIIKDTNNLKIRISDVDEENIIICIYESPNYTDKTYGEIGIIFEMKDVINIMFKGGDNEMRIQIIEIRNFWESIGDIANGIVEVANKTYKIPINTVFGNIPYIAGDTYLILSSVLNYNPDQYVTFKNGDIVHKKIFISSGERKYVPIIMTPTDGSNFIVDYDIPSENHICKIQLNIFSDIAITISDKIQLSLVDNKFKLRHGEFLGNTQLWHDGLYLFEFTIVSTNTMDDQNIKIYQKKNPYGGHILYYDGIVHKNNGIGYDGTLDSLFFFISDRNDFVIDLLDSTLITVYARLIALK